MIEDVLGLIFPEDNATASQRKLVERIYRLTGAEIKARTGLFDLPEALDPVLIGVTVIRYNRIGSEGMSQETVEGHTMVFRDDDFSGYRDLLKPYETKEEGRRGKVRWL